MVRTISQYLLLLFTFAVSPRRVITLWAVGTSACIEKNFRSFVRFATENSIWISFAGHLPKAQGIQFASTDLAIYNQTSSFILGFLVFGSKISEDHVIVIRK